VVRQRDPALGLLAGDVAERRLVLGVEAVELLRDYVAESQDAASATERAFGQAFSGAEDALTSFVTTGKLEIKGLADSVLD
jgi:lambda family phage tail tape measure protein